MSDFEVIDSGLIYDYFDSVSVYMHWHKEGKAMGRKSIRNLLTALLIVALIISPIRGLSGSAFRSYAATASEFDQLQKTFPVGTVLRSGMFPGLKVTFNGKDSIVVDENIGNVSISVTILDAELAAKEGIPILKNLFGLVKLPTKVGESVTTKVKLHSIGQAQYKNIVDNLDNEELSSLITQIFDPAVTAEQLDVLLEEFFDELSDAQDEQREAEQGQTEQSSGNGTASGQGTSGRGQAQGQGTSGNSQAQGQGQGQGQGTSGNSQAQGQSQGGSGNSGTVAPPVPSVPEGTIIPIDHDDDEPYYSDDNDGDDKEKVYDRVIMLFFDLCDLESDGENGTKNLLDLLRARIPENTKVIITTGGTLNWHMNDFAAYKKYTKNLLYPTIDDNSLTPEQKNNIQKTAQEYYDLYHVELGRETKIYEVQTTEDGKNMMVLLETYPDRYMLDKAYLTDFVDYATLRYEAEKYDLVMGDHGGGIGGFGTDEIYQDDLKNNRTQERPDVSLSMANIKSALSKTILINEGGKFDFFGFDACQMGTAEVALSLRETSDYLILSQENEPGQGWDYYAWMNALNDNPEMETRDLGTVIVNTFMRQYETWQNFNATLALIDNSRLDELYGALTGFSNALSQEVSRDSAKYRAMTAAVGKNSDYGTKSGYYTSGVLDLEKLCQIFTAEGSGFSDELKAAGNSLIDAVRSSVVLARGSVPSYGNNGLSINFPVQAYTRVNAGKNDKGEPLYYNRYMGDETIILYKEMEVNPDYQRAYAELALKNVIAHIIGEAWDENNYTVDTVVKDLRDKKGYYKAAGLIEASQANLDNPQDPLYDTINSLYEKRVKNTSIGINKGEDNTSTVASIALNEVDPAVIDGVITVNVTINTNGTTGTEIPLGSTAIYSDVAERDEEFGSITWNVNAFNNKWLTLNDQITSFYMTSMDNQTGEYTGYIPLAIWSNLAEVEGDAATSREKYIAKVWDNNGLTNIRLNVTGKYDLEDEEKPMTEYLFTNYDVIGNGGEVSDTNQLSNLESNYLELLGGAADSMVNGLKDDSIFSMGTIYVGTVAELRLEQKTIPDLKPGYYITDAYGNSYELSSDNLGVKDYGLENFTLDEPQVWETSYINSQEAAAAIRKQATEDSKAADTPAGDDDQQDGGEGQQQDGDQQGDQQQDGEEGDQQDGDQQGDDQQDGEEGDQQDGDQQGDQQQGEEGDQQDGDQQGDDQQDGEEGDQQDGDQQQDDEEGQQQDGDQQGDQQQGEEGQQQDGDQQGDQQQDGDQQDGQQGEEGEQEQNQNNDALPENIPEQDVQQAQAVEGEGPDQDEGEE